MEDRPGSHRGLPATVGAHPAGLRGPPVPIRTAGRAHETVRPTQARKVVQARGVVREPCHQLLKRLRIINATNRMRLHLFCHTPMVLYLSGYPVRSRDPSPL